MEINFKGITIIVGSYGSGKTEISINLAKYAKNKNIDVKIADLDLVNPYFRTREARQSLADHHIHLILPSKEYLYADLPILAPEVSGLIRNPSELVILDVGGDGVGARVLAALGDALKQQPYRMLQVLNPFRPFTDSHEGCLKIKKEIEESSKLTIDGIIGNPHLIDETSLDTVYQGFEFVNQFCTAHQLPFECMTIACNLIDKIDLNRISCPVLPIDRHLLTPWKSNSKNQASQ